MDNPPISWRYCGDQVRLWRHIAGVSREELATEASYSVETVRSMEQGRRKPTKQLLEAADQLCGAKGLLLAACPYMGPEVVQPRYPEFIAAEAEAVAVHGFELVLIPGLLQIEDYARSLIAGQCPPVDDETVEQRLQFRMDRQELLKKPTTLFTYVIYEAALRTLVGGPEVMRRQLQHLLDVGEQRNVFIQVLPFSVGRHPGLDGSFTMLEGAEHERVGYEEGQVVAELHGGAEALNDLTNRLALIRMQALSEEQSRRFIRKMMEEL
ncbi:helix-turn-helix domain-containing protein [Streptomyces sp. UNOC14_S4]|nr:helix-turn-helix domain-containing protein [Streptomyces sp. UNOC14_S4]